MKAFLVQSAVLSVILAEKVKRTPFDGLGSTFSSFKGPSFFTTSGISSYPAPAPPNYSAPAPPKYSAPAPKYPQPTYPKPSYGHQESHNCSIQEEKTTATVCVPSLGSPECSPVTLKGVEVVEKTSATVCVP